VSSWPKQRDLLAHYLSAYHVPDSGLKSYNSTTAFGEIDLLRRSAWTGARFIPRWHSLPDLAIVNLCLWGLQGMVAKVRTVAFQGVEVIEVETQVTIASGLPAFTIVGLPDKAVAESRERVRAALGSLGLGLPSEADHSQSRSGRCPQGR